MDEHGFIRAVHRQLPGWIDAWKVNTAYRGGIFDTQYFGLAGKHLFIEYKYTPKLPKRPTTVLERTELSALQKIWGKDKLARGIPVYTVQGHDGKGVLSCRKQEYEGVTLEFFNNYAVPIKEIAAFITGELDDHISDSGDTDGSNNDYIVAVGYPAHIGPRSELVLRGGKKTIRQC